MITPPITLLQQWRSADAVAREEERRLFYRALSSVSDGDAPRDSEWIACGELRSAADALFNRATAVVPRACNGWSGRRLEAGARAKNA